MAPPTETKKHDDGSNQREQREGHRERRRRQQIAVMRADVEAQEKQLEQVRAERARAVLEIANITKAIDAAHAVVQQTKAALLVALAQAGDGDDEGDREGISDSNDNDHITNDDNDTSPTTALAPAPRTRELRLTTLPRSVLRRVLLHVGIRELGRLAQCCRLLSSVCADDALWEPHAPPLEASDAVPSPCASPVMPVPEAGDPDAFAGARVCRQRRRHTPLRITPPQSGPYSIVQVQSERDELGSPSSGMSSPDSASGTSVGSGYNGTSTSSVGSSVTGTRSALGGHVSCGSDGALPLLPSLGAGDAFGSDGARVWGSPRRAAGALLSPREEEPGTRSPGGRTARDKLFGEGGGAGAVRFSSPPTRLLAARRRALRTAAVAEAVEPASPATASPKNTSMMPPSRRLCAKDRCKYATCAYPHERIARVPDACPVHQPARRAKVNIIYSRPLSLQQSQQQVVPSFMDMLFEPDAEEANAEGSDEGAVLASMAAKESVRSRTLRYTLRPEGATNMDGGADGGAEGVTGAVQLCEMGRDVERCHALLQVFFRGAQGVVVAYDASCGAGVARAADAGVDLAQHYSRAPVFVLGFVPPGRARAASPAAVRDYCVDRGTWDLGVVATDDRAALANAFACVGFRVLRRLFEH